MKDLEKRLFSELESIVPDMTEDLKKYPITTDSPTAPKRNYLRYMVLSLSTLFVLFLLVVIIGFNSSQTEVKDKYYVIDVNPSIIVVTDSNDKVTQIKSANKDADLILLGLDVERLVGKDVEEVAVKIADEFLKLGYFNKTSDNQMNISTLKSDNQKLESTLVDYFCNKGYYVAVLSEKLNLEKYNLDHATEIVSLEEFENYVSSLDVYEYIVEKDSLKNVEEIYKTEYLEDELTKIIQKEYDKTVRMQEVLTNIYTKYYELLTDIEINHIFKDYWYLLDKYDSLDEKTRIKLDEITLLINEYESLGGNEISNVEDLLNFEEVINTFLERQEVLSGLVNEVAFKINNEMFDELEILLNTHIPGIDFKHFLTLPRTTEELESKIKDIYSEVRNNLINQHKDFYEKEKTPISEEEYKDFINNFNKNK